MKVTVAILISFLCLIRWTEIKSTETNRPVTANDEFRRGIVSNANCNNETQTECFQTSRALTVATTAGQSKELPSKLAEKRKCTIVVHDKIRGHLNWMQVPIIAVHAFHVL